jgi:iron complex outermembrane receptor protein
MKRIAFQVLFVLLTLVSYGQAIEGTIKDVNHNPLANVNVVLSGTKLGATSNSDGFFSIRDLKPGEYTVEVSHIGYTSISKKINLTNSVLKFDFILEVDLVNIKEVVIKSETESKFDIINIPGRTKLIDEQEIAQIPAISASKLFNTVSGVNVSNDFGIFSTSTVVALRGIGGNSQSGTLVVLDGMPLNKTDGGSVNWNIIDKDNLEKIEIIKGPGSALYGSNAMGGIINFISKTPDGKFGWNASVSSGDYRTLEAKTSLTGSFFKGLLYWNAFVNYRKSDGYINTPDEIIKENHSIVVPVFLKEFFAGGIVGYHIDENNTLELSVNYFNDIRGRGVKIYEEVGSNIDRDTYHAFLKYKGQVKKWRIYSNVYGLYEKYFRLNENFNDGAYSLYEVDSRREDYGCRVWTETKIGRRNEITFGGETKLGKVYGRDIYYTSTDLIRNKGAMNTYALFVQDKFTFGKEKWELLAGLRFDGAVFHDASFSMENPSYSIEYLTNFQFDDVGKKQWTDICPKLTLQYLPTGYLKIYVSVAKGFSAPNLDDLCRSENSQYGFRVANPSIKPEHLYNMEVGLDNTFFKKLKTEFSFYYSIGYDFMYLLSTSDSVNLGYTIAPIFQVANISKVNVFGIEADVSSPIGKYLNAYCNYTYNHSTIADFKPNTAADRELAGKFLPNIPMNKFSAGISLLTPYFNLSIAEKYVGTRWVKDDNTVDNIYLMTDKYPAYFSTDLKLWQKAGPFDFSIEIDNLFNVVYINSKGFKSPGRMVFGRLDYQFGKKKNKRT